MTTIKEISAGELQRTASRYRRLAIGTLLSHSALQIFHGARLEGFPTLGIGRPGDSGMYRAFPLASPDRTLEVPRFDALLRPATQEKLLHRQALLIPHGSFVEYVGADNIQEKLRVPCFGNRATLAWETDRAKQREWLRRAGLPIPREIPRPSDIRGKVFVKFPGAKGGHGAFTAKTPAEFKRKLAAFRRRNKNAGEPILQEFLTGVRYYIHYFHSPLMERTEILGMDRRLETVDESYRNLPDPPELEFTVSGNTPVVVREKFLRDLVTAGDSVVAASRRLFPPGLIGPFCLESIYHPSRGFTYFEISARIVAGTNLYPTGSPYSAYLFEEPMSTGRRIAREIKLALEDKRLPELVH
ncbi:MAG: formate--phosphoribosylaminoimidazolecarboxamide ligase [Euryarchaeota archaeon]|nr:formate--phosphoribosylaminoimidazolecarboxamide ligase [Euryarchaeota archaeon]